MNRLIFLAILALAAVPPATRGQDPSPAKGATQTSRAKALPRPRAHPSQPNLPSAKHQKIGASTKVGAKPDAAANASAPSANNVQVSYADAVRRYRHESHDRAWWHHHFTIIVLVGGGYYYWDAGYWCPAWGYDSNYSYYDYDGPIFTYGNLLPDQVILNVQRALQDLGYYAGRLTGSLSANTRAAIAAYQENAGLFVNGVIDQPTVAALGLY